MATKLLYFIMYASYWVVRLLLKATIWITESCIMLDDKP